MREGTQPDEEEKLREVLSSGGNPECPRCGSSLTSSMIRPRADVAYVRDRVLLQCGVCGFRIALDRKKR